MDKQNIMDEKGAVTFLDVLGWKGIWERNPFAIGKLQDLIKKMKEKAQEITNIQDDPILRGKSDSTKVLSISDTIAVFTPSDVPQTAIGIHAELCSWALSYSLELELPLRGAISYGEYSVADNIMLGYAVDEAASWHEATDWIGVILTPSAKISLQDKCPDHVVRYDHIPFKRSIRNLDLCVRWTFDKNKRLYEVIQEKGPRL